MTRERDGGTTIDLSSSLSHFFGQAVDDAIRAHGYEATHAAEHYVVALLADYARPNQLSGETLCRPLTLLLAEALEPALQPAQRVSVRMLAPRRAGWRAVGVAQCSVPSPRCGTRPRAARASARS